MGYNYYYFNFSDFSLDFKINLIYRRERVSNFENYNEKNKKMKFLEVILREWRLKCVDVSKKLKKYI